MSSVRSFIDPGGRVLARHLNRLGETLETFGSRLREAVASAVGETVAGVVRETVRAVLAESLTRPPSPGRFYPPPGHARPLWGRPDDREEDRWFEDPDRYDRDDDEEESPPSHGARDSSRLSRWPRAFAVGIHTMLWWLRRRVGRFPVLTALGVGLLTALATYAGGPLAAVGVGLAGSAFSLMSLAEVVHTGADTLAPFGSS